MSDWFVFQNFYFSGRKAGISGAQSVKALQNQPNTGLCYKDFVEKLYESGKYLSNHAVCDGSRHCYVGSLTMFCKLGRCT